MSADRTRNALGLVLVATLVCGCKTGTGSNAGAAPLLQGYTCCNLHAEGDWISDSNYTTLPMIPVGSPIRVIDYGSNRASVEINGKPYRLGHDYGRAQETLEQWVAKIVVTQDPKLRIAKLPGNVREAIRSGRIVTGMTREQVVMAVGYPLTSENASFEAPTWRMWVSSFGEYQLNWSGNGRLSQIVVSDPTTRNLIEYRPH